MVHTFKPIITAILALSAAAPIFAAPLKPRIDSAFSSVNNGALVPTPPTQSPATKPEAVPAPAPASAPEAAAKETSSSGVEPTVVGGNTPAAALYLTNGLSNPTSRAVDDDIYLAARALPNAEQASAAPANGGAPTNAVAIILLNHTLAARGVGVEAGLKTGSAKPGRSLRSPVAQDLMERTVLAAVSSILRREPEFAHALSRELATELEARSAISSATPGDGAGSAVTNDLIQHLSRAGGSAESSDSSSSSSSSSDSSSSSESGASNSGSTPPTSVSTASSPGLFWQGNPDSDSESAAGASSQGSPAGWASDVDWSYLALGHQSGSDHESGSSAPASVSSGSEPESEGGIPSTSSTGSHSNVANNPAEAALAAAANLGTGATAAGAAVGKALNLRDLDADTLHLLGRDLEDLVARSFGIDDLD